MNVGKMSSTSRLKAIQAIQTYSHQRSPIFAISHRTSISSGRPSAAASTACFARSTTNSFGVMRLKPNCASMTKVRYSDSGSSRAAISTTTAAKSAAPCHRPCASNTRPHCAEIQSMRPPSVSASSTAAPSSTSIMPRRALATV